MNSPRYTSIDQFVHTLSYGDAISGEALALKRYFASQGVKSRLFAINIDPKLRQHAEFYGQYSEENNSAVVLHYSLGSPLNQLYRDIKRARKHLIYHNLTPFEWFVGINPRIVNDIKKGMLELPELCGISDVLIADSKFNALELRKLGFRSEVLELPLDPERWNIEANAGIQDLLCSSGKINIAHVGRIAPNKCIEDLIRAFYFLHHKIDRNSHLWLAGIDIDTEIYSFSLKRLVYEFSLQDAVSFVGRFEDSELKALYQNSDVYLCASEHEGFCMPVIEAMHFSLPVIAYASSALPDTVSGGGILTTNKSPEILAELIYRVAKDTGLQTKLIAQGKQRAAELSFERFGRRVSEIFDRAAPQVLEEALQA